MIKRKHFETSGGKKEKQKNKKMGKYLFYSVLEFSKLHLTVEAKLINTVWYGYKFM